MKTLMMTSAVALMLSGVAYAADVNWDADANGQVDRSEYDTAIKADAGFGALDTDANGSLSQEEFDAGMTADATKDSFGDWDADANGELTQDEFDEGLWTSFDTDANGSLSMDETNALTDAMRAGTEVTK